MAGWGGKTKLQFEGNSTSFQKVKIWKWKSNLFPGTKKIEKMQRAANKPYPNFVFSGNHPPPSDKKIKRNVKSAGLRILLLDTVAHSLCFSFSPSALRMLGVLLCLVGMLCVGWVGCVSNDPVALPPSQQTDSCRIVNLKTGLLLFFQVNSSKVAGDVVSCWLNYLTDAAPPFYPQILHFWPLLFFCNFLIFEFFFFCWNLMATALGTASACFFAAKFFSFLFFLLWMTQQLPPPSPMLPHWNCNFEGNSEGKK